MHKEVCKNLARILNSWKSASYYFGFFLYNYNAENKLIKRHESFN